MQYLDPIDGLEERTVGSGRPQRLPNNCPATCDNHQASLCQPHSQIKDEKAYLLKVVHRWNGFLQICDIDRDRSLIIAMISRSKEACRHRLCKLQIAAIPDFFGRVLPGTVRDSLQF